MSFTDPASFLRAPKALPDLTPEVAYLIKPDLFYGSLRKAEPGDLRNKVVKLYAPRPTRRHMVLGTAALGQEQELVRYYQSVVQAAAAHRKGLRELSHYFWLRPVLLSRGEVVLTFPWHDTYPQAAEVLQSLTSPEPEGLLYHDLDQGWQLAIYATADKIYVQQGDDDGRVTDRYVTDRGRLQTLAAAALARTRQQLEIIVRGVGQDFWHFRPAAKW